MLDGPTLYGLIELSGSVTNCDKVVKLQKYCNKVRPEKFTSIVKILE